MLYVTVISKIAINTYFDISFRILCAVRMHYTDAVRLAIPSHARGGLSCEFTPIKAQFFALNTAPKGDIG